MERTDTSIKVWYWLRNAGNVPSDVRNGAATINTSNWVSSSSLAQPFYFRGPAFRARGKQGLKRDARC